MNIINPATEEIIQTVAEDTKETIYTKFQAAKTAQNIWKDIDLKKRIAVIEQFYNLLETNKESLALTLTNEVGKPLQQSRNEINGARSRIKFFIDNSEKYLSDEWMLRDTSMSEMIAFEPLGTIANISAWNYPYLVGVNVFIPALIAGNAVLYKPSEYATLTGLQIEKLLYQAGLPENVFQAVIGPGQAGEVLLQLPLDGYFFTGSYKTGKYIYEKVAPKMVPCGMELGGKDPLYVTDDITDIRGVAAATADGAFYNNGQSCCAVERIYVHENIYKPYLEEFVKEVKSYKIGNPTEEGVYIAPLTREAQLAFLEYQVNDAISKGATLLTGGKRLNRKGYFFEPTVLTDVTHEMSVMKEESFGPIIGIMKVKNDEEAIRLMLDTEYGLTAAVYSDTYARAKPILDKMETGTVYWNCCDRLSPQLPWSGRKHSGIGATLSYMGIRAFVKPKAYHLKGKLT
jgi:acyl-CoA reductase-like NAD-dependent aldehyde dehydrogenase